MHSGKSTELLTKAIYSTVEWLQQEDRQANHTWDQFLKDSKFLSYQS